MKKIKKHCAMAGFALGALLLSSWAMAGKYDADRTGGRDHPQISRYAGSTLNMYGDENYGVAGLAVIENGKPALRMVEGRISNKFYLGPKGRSPLEIFRNYQSALKAAGFETLLACEATLCEKTRVLSLVQNLPRKARWQEADTLASYIFHENDRLFHFISARKISAGGMVHMQLALRSGEGDNAEIEGRTPQFVQIVESAQVEEGKVVVDAKAIGNSLKRDGKIALYGILFDTNKSVVKAESGQTLEEMAKTLKVEPGLSVYIVGHTDNQGAVDANVALSQKRAEAVADILTRQYGIAGARLQARGVANFAPVASNLDEDGRAKNRRVEMVVR